MHLLVRETRSLDENAPAQDLGQSPAPLVVLSFSDADLGALSAVWTPAQPALRLASLARLRHPLSVDLYLEQVAAHARCIIVRLLGGLDYWRYGAEEIAALCRTNGIALALLPGDAADDTRLQELSTIAQPHWSTLDACFRAGGPQNMDLVLQWAAHLAGKTAKPTTTPQPVPQYALLPLPPGEGRGEGASHRRQPKAAIILYRSHVLSADIAPIEALAEALQSRGLTVRAIYVDSLKSPETADWTAQTLKTLAPDVILNATAFSARQNDGPSPLEAAGAPILQLVLSGSSKPAWQASTRGLSPTDLAMHVVLPELDGRLLTGAISFKAETPQNPDLQYARTIHQPDPHGIALAADRAAAWARLATTPAPRRRVAIILSDYPGIGGQQGHAVGLDTFASLATILTLLNDHAYSITPLPQAALTNSLCTTPPQPYLSVSEYKTLLAALPPPFQQSIQDAWGAPAEDPSVHDGHFTLRHLHTGHATLALQPNRGAAGDRRAAYHDPDQPPRHAYVAFHLWLRHVLDIHAMIQLGAHGSLEWLPGKAAALSPDCAPHILLGGLPVIYPFIVNNPGEAACAKRRLGAVTIGHLTPPIRPNTHHGPAQHLERLIDEYAAADGMDRRRTTILRAEILHLAQSAGLLAETNIPPDTEPGEALARLDAYLCDVKDLQLRNGLHIYGSLPPLPQGEGRGEGDEHPQTQTTRDSRAASPQAERQALLAALDGRFIRPGPAGAPTRLRPDVLPTGRNLTTVDPRAVPTQTALALAEKAADALLARHRQLNGDYPGSIILDLWASAAMRTGGEDLALAYILLGARPLWDNGSARVSGFEIIPLALLDRPRIDVTLRISGLFRDAFATQIAQFDALTRAIAARDEAPDWNPLANTPDPTRSTIRVYGPPAGQYGAGDATGAAWLAASAGAYGKDQDGVQDPSGLAARVAAADAFVHIQDHAEHDLLDSPEWAAHEGGFAQAAAHMGNTPALYHLDTSTPTAPKPRTLPEEIARIVRGRAANPAWIAGQMRHAYRGAAEIARPLAALEAYARSLDHRFDPQFDLLHAATIGAPEVNAFLRRENPAAHADLAARFAALQADGLWRPTRTNLPPC
jgi:cobaltochelatase CobN